MVDQTTVETLVEEITREVLLRLSQPAPANGNGCNCTGGVCVRDCADKVDQVVQAGANRITSTLGALPQNGRIARMIDHTLLKADASDDQIAQLCYEARTYHFASVCVTPAKVKLAAQLLKGSDVAVCTVVGFPLGATPANVKAYETEQAIRDGATEIDMVINIGALKSQDYQTVLEDIGAVVRMAHAHDALVKVIIEAALLTDEEKVIASQLVKTAGADYVKTSTGFGPGGATVEDVALMRRVVGPSLGVKAAGGVGDYAKAQEMIAAGATRIGASAGIKIVDEALGKNQSVGRFDKSPY
ncbi:MAG: deoxyribose-phosphate aldolase [Chloroflexi bacterium]|nr:deoxyribose-phosphate aldolase [Chloroflexota bacterium]